MPEPVNSSKDLLDVLIQVLIVVIPVLITWFIRTYVKSSAAETQVAAIVRLANSAINFVENLDRRGELNLPPDVKKGAGKLQLAGQWLESELKRAGINMTDEQAQKWIASEFQKRAGDVRAVTAVAELTKEAVRVIEDLDQRQLLDIPPDVDRAVHLAGLATDWLLAKLALTGTNIPRDEALTLVRYEFLQRLGTQAGVPLVNAPAKVRDPLADLAERAVAFIAQLKASGQLTPQPGTGGEQFELDVAVAWALNEATMQGIEATRPQIAEAISAARGQPH